MASATSASPHRLKNDSSAAALSRLPEGSEQGMPGGSRDWPATCWAVYCGGHWHAEAENPKSSSVRHPSADRSATDNGAHPPLWYLTKAGHRQESLLNG